MVSSRRRNWGTGEEIPRGVREYRSLERRFRGTPDLSSDIRRRPLIELLTETIVTYVQEDILWIADPKAINHILQKSGYLYEKPANFREGIALLTGRGILSAEGELLAATSFSSWLIQQCRRRRAQAPQESNGSSVWLSRGERLVTVFCGYCYKGMRSLSVLDLGGRVLSYFQMADKWSNIIANSKSGHSATIDVNLWFGKATLDACVSALCAGGLRTDS